MINRIRYFGLCAVLIALSYSATLQAGSLRETPLVKAVRDAKIAVVNIHSEKTTYSSDAVFQNSKGRKVNGMGTGVVIDERGYIVTNHHVVDGVDSLRVTLVDGSNYDAKVISYDSGADLAIIKIKPTKKLKVMTIGTSSDLMLGETVIAVGNAFGYEHTVTSGIISSLSRDVEVNETQSYRNLIQTDASINPGNSGGPLLNLDGEVVGINVAIRAGAQRIGFAIPIDDARQIIANLMSVNSLENTHHGLVSHDVKTAEERKLIVEGAENESPAEKAGLQKGDVILQVEEVNVMDRVDFERALLGKKAGEKVSVVYERDGEKQTAQMEIASFDPTQVVRVNAATSIEPEKKAELSLETRVWQTLGIKTTALGSDKSVLANTPYEDGLRITSVKVGSPAARSLIHAGDVLVGMHTWRIESLENVEYVLDSAEVKSNSGAVKFYVIRGRNPLHGELDLASTLR